MKGLTNLTKLNRGRQRRPRLILTTGVLLLVALFAAACGQAASTAVPASVPTVQPTAVAPTSVPPTQEMAAAPTSVPPTQEATTAPTSAPTAQPTTVAPTPSGASPTVAVGEAEVDLEDFQFVPKVLTVKVGTRVKFSNKDKVGHTVTSDTGVFDSGLLQKGQEFFFTFTQAGDYPYYCAPHGGPGGQGMSGKVIVVP